MKEEYIPEEIPVMPVGKYRGVKLDALPESYCRWIMSQDFPEEIMKYARAKVNTNKTDNISIDVTRHALDSFSLRFLYKFFDREDRKVGIETFVAQLADEAFQKGKDVSKHRHQDEEIIKVYDGIKYVFNRKGELRILITVFLDDYKNNK